VDSIFESSGPFGPPKGRLRELEGDVAGGVTDSETAGGGWKENGES
jgi:hypothetical protein